MGHLVLCGIRLVLVVQATQASVTGTVRDERTGLPLAGVLVTLTELGRETSTDPAGGYRLPDVPPGPYHLDMRLIGYAPRTLHAFVPRTGGLEINVSLRPHPVPLPPIEVRPRPTVAVRGMEPGDAAFPDRRVTIAAIRDHPLLAEPDAFEALAGGEVTLRPESPGGLHIRGGAADHTVYLLDDVPVFSPYHAAGLFSAWNPDALAELQLSAAVPPTASPDALSGVVAGVTRPPGSALQAQGGVSSTQARVTVDGPVGVGGMGFLVSLRAGLPDAVAPRNEGSYLRGEVGDRLAKLEAPVVGGRARLLGYDSENELSAAASAFPEAGPYDPSRRNAFEWSSRSIGVEWSRSLPGMTVRATAWSAAARAAANWTADAGPTALSAERHEEGLLAVVGGRTASAPSSLGMRVTRGEARYRVADSAGAASWERAGALTTATVFADVERALGARLRAGLGTSLGTTGQTVQWGPRAHLRWRPIARLTLSAGYARRHQYAQSLRNGESVVGNVFPADLYVVAGAPGVPVARSDQGVLAVDYRPAVGVRLGAQAFLRGMDGLLFAAPAGGEPFATDGFAVGSGVARGGSLEAGLTTGRVGLVAAYGIQRVRYEADRSRYTPEHGVGHVLESGVIVYPRATLALRLAVTGAWGRHATPLTGGFEWEACNLADRGCEFVGSPRSDAQALGAARLPSYLRVDLGFRKHWHVRLAGRDGAIALFGTVTNLFGRQNVLAYAADPGTGAPVPITMRPRAPLVMGLDWRF